MTTRNMYAAVGFGGMIGAAGRYCISIIVPYDGGFPFATLITNLVGCFLLSYLLNQSALKQLMSQKLLTAIGTGIIGSFTTFSTFMVETVALYDTAALLAIIYVGVSVIGGLILCSLGYWFASRRGVKQ